MAKIQDLQVGTLNTAYNAISGSASITTTVGSVVVPNPSALPIQIFMSATFTWDHNSSGAQSTFTLEGTRTRDSVLLFSVNEVVGGNSVGTLPYSHAFTDMEAQANETYYLEAKASTFPGNEGTSGVSVSQFDCLYPKR